MINTNKDPEHRYILRSCLNCDRLRQCHVINEVDSAVMHADKAKFGCVKYIGIHSDEQSKNEKRRARSNKQKG